MTLKKTDNKYPAMIIIGLRALSDMISNCFIIKAAIMHRLQIKAILETSEKVIVITQLFRKSQGKITQFESSRIVTRDIAG